MRRKKIRNEDMREERRWKSEYMKRTGWEKWKWEVRRYKERM